MKDAVWKERDSLKNVYDLMDLIEDLFWHDRVILNCIINGYNSMSNRIKKLIERAGSHINY
jgi:hypothetical protein